MAEKPYLSPTQIDSFTRCGEAYRRRYVEKERIPPGIALLKGTSVHKGAEANNLQKLETRQDLKAQDIVDVAAAEFDSRASKEDVTLAEEEQSRGKSIVLGEALDSTVRMAGAYAGLVAPKYQPQLVESRQKIEVPEAAHDLLAILDLVDEKDAVVEIKTAGKTGKQEDWDNSVQLSIQALTMVALKGKAPSSIQVEQIVDLKSGPKVVTWQTTRSKPDFDALIQRYSQVSKAITAGIFTPATPGAWWCSPKFCGYWRSCKFVNSERKEAAAKAELGG